jgi:hypothetical protein
MLKKITVREGAPKPLWQRATSVFVGWFAGHTFQTHNMCYTKRPEIFIVLAYFTNLAAGGIILRVGRSVDLQLRVALLTYLLTYSMEQSPS